MRNIITRSCITMLMLLLLAVPALAAGRQPQRIAQFPLVIESWQQPDASVQDQLETKIDRALHVPLNETLKAVEFIPEKDCLAAWDAAEGQLTGQGRVTAWSASSTMLTCTASSGLWTGVHLSWMMRKKYRQSPDFFRFLA